MTKQSPALSVCTRLNDALLARRAGRGSSCPAVMVGWNKMLCSDPGLESHRALYAVSESKYPHPVPGCIIDSILYECVCAVYRFLFLGEDCNACVYVRSVPSKAKQTPLVFL